MKKLFSKLSYNRKKVRDTFYSLTVFQQILLAIYVLITVHTILTIFNKITKYLLNKMDQIQRKKMDKADECPDELNFDTDDDDVF